MRAAAYCRFSSDNQRDASITDQLRNIQNYCQRMGWQPPVLYKDEAVSGALIKRKGLTELLTAAGNNQFDVLLVDDLTRLGRDMSETPRIIKQLKFKGIRVIGVSDGIDSDRTGYKAEIGLRGIMGEMYLDDLAEKTHRGLTGQALAGKSAGGLAYGYKSVAIDDGYTRAIDEEQAKWVVFIFEQYATGKTPRQIAIALNEQNVPSPRGSAWAQSAIYGDIKRGIGILANRMYNGEYIWNRSKFIKDPSTGKRKRIERPESEWVIQPLPELRIVPADLWHAVQTKQLATRSNTKKAQNASHGNARNGRGPKYLFSGLLKCGTCGGNYSMLNRTHYGCSRHKSKGDTVCNNRSMIKRSTIEEILLKSIKQDLSTPANYKLFEKEVNAQLKQFTPNKTGIKQKIAKAEKEINNIMAAITAGILTPTTKQALQAAETQLDEAKKELEHVQSYQPAQILPRAREIFKRLVMQLENIEDVPAARQAIEQITGKITIIQEDQILYAEMQSSTTALHNKINLVAGAGFKTYLSPAKTIRIPLTGAHCATNAHTKSNREYNYVR